VESNLGTAIRTGVVLVVAWVIVFIKRKHHELRNIDRKELLFIVFSGLATGAYGLWNIDNSYMWVRYKFSSFFSKSFTVLCIMESL